MNITLEKSNPTNASLKVKLAQSDYQPKVAEKLKEYSRKAVIKGFRPGKVPASLIQKMYGKGILVEEINHLLTKSVNDYIRDNKLNLVGEPLPNPEESTDIDWDTQKEFEFSYSLGLAPEFAIDLSPAVKVTAYEIELGDKEVTETIERLQKQHHRHSHPETSEEGDTLAGELKQVDGDFSAYISFPLSQVDEEARFLFTGLSTDSKVSFDLRKAFETDETVSLLTGQTRDEAARLSGTFELTVSEITRHDPAPLDQEFFDRILGANAAGSEEEFMNKIREIISGNYQREAEALLNRDVQETLLNQNTFELPDEFLKRWLLVSNEGKVTTEQVEQEYALYARELRWSLIKNKIAEENKIRIEHEEVFGQTRQLIRQQFGLSGPDERMDATIDNFANNYLKAEQGKNYLNIYNQLLSERILTLAKKKIGIEKKTVEVEEFKKLAAA